MNKKQISLFLPHIGFGGLTHVMLLLADGLVKNGFTVELVILNTQIPEKLTSKLPTHVSIMKLNARRTITSLLPLILYLRKRRPNILISGGPSSNIIALLAKKISNIDCKQIITEHSLPSVDVYDSNKFLDKFIPFLMRRLYKNSNQIIAVSHAVKDDLSSFINNIKYKINVIYNPVVTERMLELAEVDTPHKWLDDPTYKVAVFVGRLESVKNLQLALHAFSLINQNKIKFVIIGNGSEKAKLQSLVEKLSLIERVDFVGYTDNPYTYIKRADVLVLCSLWEGLPTVLIEAMALETQVVVTNNLDGAKEILLDGKIGYIVENNNPELLSLAILEAIENKENTFLLKQRAFEFNFDNIIYKYIKLF